MSIRRKNDNWEVEFLLDVLIVFEEASVRKDLEVGRELNRSIALKARQGKSCVNTRQTSMTKGTS